MQKYYIGTRYLSPYYTLRRLVFLTGLRPGCLSRSCAVPAFARGRLFWPPLSYFGLVGGSYGRD